MRYLFCGLLAAGIFGCSHTKFNPDSIREKYVDQCLDLCSDNPNLNVVITTDKVIYQCQCKNEPLLDEVD